MDPCRGGIACEICLGWVLLLFVDTAAGLHHRPPAPRPGSVPRNPPVPSTPVPPAPSTRVGPGVLLASPNSASRSVQNSPCSASWWRQRYKTLPACRKSAKSSHFGRAGRVLYRKWGRAARAGRVLYRKWGRAARAGRVLFRRGTFRVCSCRVSATHRCPILALGPCSALDTGSGGGFALHEALNRCVAGVSHPLVVQFPPSRGLPDGRGTQNADHLAKKR